MVENSLFNQVEKEIPGCLRIGVDFDNVIVPTGQRMRNTIKDRFSVDLDEIEKARTESDYWFDRWPELQAKPEVLTYIQQCFIDPGFLQGIDPFEGAVETLNSWRKCGHKPFIVTARSSPLVQVVTRQELVRIGLGWVLENGWLFFGSPSVDRTVTKPQIARDFRVHSFVEDHAETLREITSPSLMRKIIVDFGYKYNRHLDLGSETARCHSWSEIDRVISECASWHYFLHTQQALA